MDAYGGNRMMTLVTGASGLLGSAVVDLLVARGEPVRALVRPGDDLTRFGWRDVEVCRGDMGDHASLAEAVRGVGRMLHCAARTGPWGPAAEYEIANVRGTRALVELAQAAGVARIVHVSSITVHGNDVRGPADEYSPFHDEPNPYSRSKVAGERLLQGMIREQRAPVVIVRPGWIYGPRDRASFARFAALIEEGKMVIIGSGENSVPLIYVSDVARGVVLASETPGVVGQAYLLVNDEPVTQRVYYETIAAELGVAPPTRHIPYRPALALGAAAEFVGHVTGRKQPPPLMRYGLQLAGGENRFIIAKARRELGFVPEVDLAEGVQRSVAWYRATQPTVLPASASAVRPAV